MIHSLGKKPGPSLDRDQFPKFSASPLARLRAATIGLPSAASYSYGFGPIYDQGPYGDCVANACAEVDAFFLKKRRGVDVAMSRRAIYEQAKASYEPTDNLDDGLIVTDGLLVLEDFGYVLEALWPYPPMGNTPDDAALLTPVPESLWVPAFKPQSHESVSTTVAAMKLALYDRGPLIIGLNIPTPWMQTGASGLLTQNVTQADNAGGHCVAVDDYDDNRFGGTFSIRNSWGDAFGDKGRCYLPYAIFDPTNSANYFAPSEAYTLAVGA